MPQAVTAANTTLNHELATPAVALVPGCEVTILTGAGWIRMEASLLVWNQGQSPAVMQCNFAVDGIDMSGEPGGRTFSTIATGGYIQLLAILHRRLGAGQHNIEIFAASSGADATVFEHNAVLTVTELGF